MADLLHFVSQFDELKMNNSNLQNDFSFYRRSLQKVRMHGGKNSATGPNMVVDDIMANNMSMFYAQASPMARVIIDCCVYVSNVFKKCPPTQHNSLEHNSQQKSQKGMTNDKILQSLSLLSAVCYNSVRKNIVQGKMVEYCLRVLVMCVVLYDNICTSGSVFMRGSRINIPAYVKLIQSTGGPLSNTLMNSIRYSTIHLNDDNTPESIRNLVMS
ncbi:Protein fam49a [Chytriomyces hyalinus]|nr:Protein fam49a [Chytriomyces hyalinus]